MTWKLATQRNSKPIWINTCFATSMERTEGRPPITKIIFGQSDNRSQSIEVIETPEVLLAAELELSAPAAEVA